jgi:hypothetical protein
MCPVESVGICFEGLQARLGAKMPALAPMQGTRKTPFFGISERPSTDGCKSMVHYRGPRHLHSHLTILLPLVPQR